MQQATHVARSDRIHAAAMVVAALVTIAYWVEWFTNGRNRTGEDPEYVAFENAFPLADGYMAAAYVASAWYLRKGDERAVPTGIAAGSGMVFLGAMDTLYNLQHGKYRERNPAMALEAAINLASFGFGAFTMLRLWGNRLRYRC